MGTSVNQPSPPTTGWNAVAAGYLHRQIPPERVASEIWRAAQSDPGFVDALVSPVMFDCYKAVRGSTTVDAAMNAIHETVLRSGKNSVVVEFAKRAVPMAFTTSDQAHLFWRTTLFSQLTDYFISRDAPGHVGSNSRFSNIAELVSFKNTLRHHVANAVRSLTVDPKTQKQWVNFIHSALKKVAG